MLAPQLKIVSGGQTGADRAALDFAIRHGIPHGGWCPAGRRAEDGRIDARYQLRETPRAAYIQRTEWNVRDSDGTVVFSMGPALQGGSREPVLLARRQGNPLLRVWRGGDPEAHAKKLRRFLEDHEIKVLNVAGPRASEEPGMYEFVSRVLVEMLTDLGERPGG